MDKFNQATELFEKADFYSKQENYEKAIELYGRSIQLNPFWMSSYINRGILYANQEKYEEAIYDFSNAINLSPESVIGYVNRGTIYLKQGKYEEALLDFNKVIKLNPKNAHAYNGIASICLKKGHYKESINNYNKAIELNPNFIEAYFNRGRFYKEQGNYEKAIADFEKAIELNPNFREAHKEKASILYITGQDPTGEYKKTIQLNPFFNEIFNPEESTINQNTINTVSLKINQRITKPINSNSTSKDYLNREHISKAISLYLRAKKESISTIGIFSTWGNGKSSFIKNILEKLKEKPDKNEVEILPIEIDAVFSDDCEKIWIIIYKKLIEEYKNQISNCRFIQNFLKLIFHLCSIGILYLLFPLLSIKPLLVYGYIFLLVYSLLFLLFIEFKRYYKWLNNLSLKIQDFLLETIIYFRLFYKPTIILIANAVMFFMLKNDVIKYTEKVKFANLEINKVSLIAGIISFIWIFCDFTKNIVSVLNKESFISAYKHEEKLGFKSVIHQKINNVIEKIIDGKDRKILIIVDELDRASLDKINEIIESTHILLNNNNLMFLFSVNPRQIGKALLLKEESLADEIEIYKHGKHYIEKYMDIYLYLPFSKDYSNLLDNLLEEDNLEEGNLEEGNLEEGNLEEGNLEEDNLEEGNLEEDNLEEDNLEEGNLEEDNLEEDNLEEGNLEEGNLEEGNLEEGETQDKTSKIKGIMKFPKDEKQEIKITINKIAEYSNLTPRKLKTIITLSTLAVQIFSSKNLGSTREERLSLMKFILINLGLLDFMDMSEILKEKDSVYTKFLEKIVLKTGKEENNELVKDIDIDFVNFYVKEYLSLFAEKLDFN